VQPRDSRWFRIIPSSCWNVFLEITEEIGKALITFDFTSFAQAHNVGLRIWLQHGRLSGDGVRSDGPETGGAGSTQTRPAAVRPNCTVRSSMLSVRVSS